MQTCLACKSGGSTKDIRLYCKDFADRSEVSLVAGASLLTSTCNMNWKICALFVQLWFCFSVSQLYEDDDCELENNVRGRCVRLQQCPSAIELIHKREYPVICSFDGFTPIVCCPVAQTLKSRLSEQKCQIYKMLTTTTTTTTTSTTTKPHHHHKYKVFVVGGINALVQEFPHMAALGFASGNKKLWMCGGTLISERFVLTAAHCLYTKDYGQLKWVRLGDLDLFDDLSLSDYSILRLIPHPDFKLPSRYNDIALIELEFPVMVSDYIKPACLPTDVAINPTEQLIATGWGLTAEEGRQSDILQKVELEVFSELECENAYQDMVNGRKLKNGIMHERMFCAGGRSEKKDTCQGDSGGPLQSRIGETTTVIGVTSFGKSCGIVNLPGVYTKVAPYVPWIESIVWPDEY